MYPGDRIARTLGYATLVVAALAVTGFGLRWGSTRSLASPMVAFGALGPAVWTAVVWAGGYWHWRRDTAGRDVAVVAAWVVGMGLNFGLLLWIIVEQQRLVGVRLAEPTISFAGVVSAGMFNGLVIGSFHVSAREKARTIDRDRRLLQRRTEQLEFLNRLMRHDIRNDVAVIRGYAELLADGDGDESIERILRKSYHIEELTDIAREVNDTLSDDELQVVDLSHAFRDALDRTRTSYPEAEFDVDADLSEDLPVVANPLLGSVFENLLRNAVQHNDAPTPRVRVTVLTSADAVTVRVADNGPGVSESAKRNLFRAGEKGSESKGMGLGLYLVETLVTNYGGDVWIEDNDPRGAVFAVKLRRADVRATPRTVARVEP